MTSIGTQTKLIKNTIKTGNWFYSFKKKLGIASSIDLLISEPSGLPY
jgi:hypothetical protein